MRAVGTPAGATTYTQDARGNQSVERWPNGSVITVAYDGFARLTRYKVGLATQAMLYSGDDERIRVVTTPEVGLADTRIYMYDLDHRLVGEYGGAGVTDVKAEYIWTLPEVGASGPTGGDDGLGGYMPLAVVVGTAADLRWVHSHHNGAPILMTNSAGAIVPHGDHAVMGFPGQYANAKQLAGAQHYYNRYRDYNAATGRYIQADPIGLAGDDNPYAYALGNALRYTDPTGEFVPILVGLAIRGALIGAGSDLAIQAAAKAMQGKAVFNPSCYDWGQVAISGALGALGARPGNLAANPFKGKTPQQIARMLENRGFLPRGPNPAAGRGTFVNPQTGRGYHIDANHPPPKGPPVSVHRPRAVRGTMAPWTCNASVPVWYLFVRLPLLRKPVG